MRDFNYTQEVVRSIRRIYGVSSPMNVFPKTFTRTLSIWEEAIEHIYDPPKIGTVLNIRKPVRFQPEERRVGT